MDPGSECGSRLSCIATSSISVNVSHGSLNSWLESSRKKAATDPPGITTEEKCTTDQLVCKGLVESAPRQGLEGKLVCRPFGGDQGCAADLVVSGDVMNGGGAVQATELKWCLWTAVPTADSRYFSG